MAKTTTIPITQSHKIGHAFFSNARGLIWQALQVGGSDYTAGTEGSILKVLTVNNSDTTAVPTILWGLLDPNSPVVQINTITAVNTTAATVVTTTNSGQLSSVTNTSPLGKYMLLKETAGNGALWTGAFISAMVSTSAFTMSAATTGGVSPTAGTVTAIPWQILGAVTTPAGAGALAGGTTINVDLLGALNTGMSFDSVGKPIVFVPSGYKVIVAATVIPTAPAAATGFYSVTGQFEEF